MIANDAQSSWFCANVVFETDFTDFNSRIIVISHFECIECLIEFNSFKLSNDKRTEFNRRGNLQHFISKHNRTE